MSFSIGATILLIAPIGIHRMLFRRHRLGTVVATAHHLAYAGTMLLALTLAGVMMLIFGAVRSVQVGIVAAVVTALGLLIFWVVLPLVLRRTEDRPTGADGRLSDPGTGESGAR